MKDFYDAAHESTVTQVYALFLGMEFMEMLSMEYMVKNGGSGRFRKAHTDKVTYLPTFHAKYRRLAMIEDVSTLFQKFPVTKSPFYLPFYIALATPNTIHRSCLPANLTSGS